MILDEPPSVFLPEGHQTEPPPNQTLVYFKLAGTLLVLVCAGWFLFRPFRGDQHKVNTKPFESFGGWAAEETAKLLNKSGKVLVLCDVADAKMSSTDPLKQVLQAQDAQVAAFKQRLGSLGKFETVTGSYVGGIYYLCGSMLVSAAIISFLGLGHREKPTLK